MNVTSGGPEHGTFEAEKMFYETRRGQLELACERYHAYNKNRQLRTETLSKGRTKRFPVYRLSWQPLGSVQRRFRECNDQIRAESPLYGSPQHLALEFYLGAVWRGLLLEMPGVRK